MDARSWIGWEWYVQYGKLARLSRQDEEEGKADDEAHGSC